jgi:ATP-dependent protease ClpP protease subunit
MDYSEPSFKEFIRIMRSVGPDDYVKILINSVGGDVTAGIECYELFQRVNSIGIVTGECASAALMAFLGCKERFCIANARFLAHGGWYGEMGGKVVDVAVRSVYDQKQLKKMYSEYMQKYFKEAEIDLILNGKEYYFDSKEAQKRKIATIAILGAIL